MMEMGTSRDPEKVKIVLENANILTPLVHGWIIFLSLSFIFLNLFYVNSYLNIYCIAYLFRIRALGSAALNMCMVALGGADVCFEFGIHAWDIAAGDIIVREAGGVCIDPAGNLIYISILVNIILISVFTKNVTIYVSRRTI